MKTSILLLFMILSAGISHAQVAINAAGAPPAASAMLDVSSTNKGVLFPQVALDSLKDVTKIASPANGLIVYNTTQPGVRFDLVKGYYYYDATALTWVRLADNQYDNVWQQGGFMGIELKNKTLGVEMMDPNSGFQFIHYPKQKILKVMDSLYTYNSHNVNALVLSGSIRKSYGNWINRQKTSLIFENNYTTPSGAEGLAMGGVISSYVEGSGFLSLKRGLNFYTFSAPQFTAIDTPSVSMMGRRVAVGAYAIDDGSVYDARLQVTNFNESDHLSLINPAGAGVKWSMYVDGFGGDLSFYRNNSVMGVFSGVNGAYTNYSDSRVKKDLEGLKPVLNDLLALKALSYRYAENSPEDEKTLGFMAQEVRGPFPELVTETQDRMTNEKRYLLNYSGFSVVAVKAIQEQQAIITDQQRQIDELKAEIKEIKKSLLKK